MELFFLDKTVWLLLVITFLFFVIIKPVMLSLDVLSIILFSTVPVAFIVLAESVCLLSGNIDISVGAMTGCVAMGSGMVLIRFPGIPPYLYFFLPLFFGLLCGMLNGFLVGVLRLNSLIATLGTFTVFEGATILISPYNLKGNLLPEVYKLPGGEMWIAVTILLSVILCLGVILHYTRFGTYIYATGGGSMTSSMLGINTKKIIFYTFALGGTLCGISALMYTGFLGCVTINLANGTIFPAITGAVIGGIALSGGRGSVVAAFGGILFLGVIQGGLTMFNIHPMARQIFIGALLIFAIVLNQIRDKERTRILKP